MADACQERVRSASISAAEVAAHPHIYVLRVTKVVLGPRDSRYGPPFTFEARVVHRLKGTVKRGAIVRGRTTTQRFRSECPVSLQRGKTYLLFLTGKGGHKPGSLVLQRFGSRYLSSKHPNFRRAVAEVRHLLGHQPRRK